MMKKINNLFQTFFESFLQSFEFSSITITINVVTTILSLIKLFLNNSTSTHESISIPSNWIHNAFYPMPNQNSSKLESSIKLAWFFMISHSKIFFNFYLILGASNLDTRLQAAISDKISVYIACHDFMAIEDRNPAALKLLSISRNNILFSDVRFISPWRICQYQP